MHQLRSLIWLTKTTLIHGFRCGKLCFTQSSSADIFVCLYFWLIMACESLCQISFVLNCWYQLLTTSFRKPVFGKHQKWCRKLNHQLCIMKLLKSAFCFKSVLLIVQILLWETTSDIMIILNISSIWKVKTIHTFLVHPVHYVTLPWWLVSLDCCCSSYRLGKVCCNRFS